MIPLYAAFEALRASREAAGAGAKADAAAARAESLAARMARLETRVEALTLLSFALAEVLEARGGATEQEILREVARLDLLDGVPDRKMAVPARECRRCGRRMALRHAHCFYCGADGLRDLPPASVADLLGLGGGAAGPSPPGAP